MNESASPDPFHHLGSHVCPIYGSTDRSGNSIIGSAIPYRDHRGAYLLTASHVIEGLADQESVITSGADERIRITSRQIHWTKSDRCSLDADIAALKLPEAAVPQLEHHFRFTEEADIGKTEAYDKLKLYAYVGYPTSKNMFWRGKTLLEAKPFYIVLREFDESIFKQLDGKSSETHFAHSALMKKATDVSNRRITPPSPTGLSGGGVWRLNFCRDTGERLDQKLVGIIIECHKSPPAFIATRIDLGMHAINALEIANKTLHPTTGNAPL